VGEREVAVEVAEVSVEGGSRVEDQKVAGLDRPVRWLANDVVDAAGSGGAHQVRHVVCSLAKDLAAERSERFALGHAGGQQVRQFIERIGDQSADVTVLLNLCLGLDHPQAADDVGDVNEVAQLGAEAIHIAQRHADVRFRTHGQADGCALAGKFAHAVHKKADAVVVGLGRGPRCRG